MSINPTQSHSQSVIQSENAPQRLHHSLTAVLSVIRLCAGGGKMAGFTVSKETERIRETYLNTRDARYSIFVH
eukprot:scaffold84032_cov63-Phaeocystis_antarctica.AAC.4